MRISSTNLFPPLPVIDVITACLAKKRHGAADTVVVAERCRHRSLEVTKGPGSTSEAQYFVSRPVDA